MARSRNIKPGFFTNDVLGELPALTRLLFAGLWTLCDREGRLEDRPKKIRAETLPYDVCDADEMLQSLEKAGFLHRYEADGQRVIQVLAWHKHQNPHVKEAASTLPPPGGVTGSPVQAPDKNSASSGQESDYTSPLPALAGLIPDPLLLIPDSLNKKEPNGSVARTSLPTCQTQSVVDLFHEVLPELPAVRLLNYSRKKAIAGFWKFVLTSKRSDGTARATDAASALLWIRDYFERTRENDFLMGRGSKASGHEYWTCDIDFLLSDKGKKHVIEKTKEAA